MSRMTTKQRTARATTTLTILLAASPAAVAYIGPGSGISVIGSLLGLLATVLIALGAIFLFPFRRMLKKRGAQEAAEPVVAEGDREHQRRETAEEPETEAR